MTVIPLQFSVGHWISTYTVLLVRTESSGSISTCHEHNDPPSAGDGHAISRAAFTVGSSRASIATSKLALSLNSRKFQSRDKCPTELVSTA